MRLTIILTRTPHASRTLETYVKLALLACSREHSVAVYLVGDGVYCARKGQNSANYLERLSKFGGELFLRKEDIEARGLDVDKLIEEVEVPVDFYGKLVDDIMEKSDRVISL